ncbi:PepSY domain-containing protein [Ramlibacter sp. AN1015]|uniref:PepSY domain-containing protein n=1 Tax=Ramlibacter sp. AN1015 TaxID=3133428 RepID=UPI0030C3FF82
MKLLMSLACAVLMFLAPPVWAAVSADQAAAVAQRTAGGRVLLVEPADQGGRPVWRVKLLTARGEVRVLLIDAASGRPL